MGIMTSDGVGGDSRKRVLFLRALVEIDENFR